MKTVSKTAHWGIFYEFFWTLPVTKEIPVHTTWHPLFQDLRTSEYTSFDLRLFCNVAPLKHWPEAIQLSKELFKVLGHLSWTFSSCRTPLRLRRLWSKCKGALLTIRLFKDLVIRISGPFIHVLMLHYGCSCCNKPFAVAFLKPVPLLISCDVICVKILHLNNLARF